MILYHGSNTDAKGEYPLWHALPYLVTFTFRVTVLKAGA